MIDDVVQRMIAPPSDRVRDERRAMLQIFMNRNDSLTDDAMTWLHALLRVARAEGLEYAAEVVGKTTGMKLVDMARRVREGASAPAEEFVHPNPNLECECGGKLHRTPRPGGAVMICDKCGQ